MKRPLPKERVAGFLEVGYNDSAEVVLNISVKDFETDGAGRGHIVFSPRQARNLAKLLIKHATLAEEEWRK